MTLTLATLATQLGDALKQQALTLATAESCTGGGLSYWMTSISGSSKWFERGFVTYSDAAKIEMLGISPHLIETFGAVSEETARAMANGVLKHSHADVSIAITGIAGPSGGSESKPVGTVWIAWASRHHLTEATLFVFKGDREAIRDQAMKKAMEHLLTML